MTTKERIADMLRAQGASAAAGRFLEGLMGRVEFGPNVTVYVDEEFGGTKLTVGVNWSALGTVSAGEAFEMARNLRLAAALACCIQEVIEQS